MKLLLIDNYDSFTYNLLHLFGSIDEVDVTVVRNDDDFLGDLVGYDGVIIGPGPGSPDDDSYFGACSEVLHSFDKPILGVCLGFQGMAIAAGAKLKRAKHPMHGKVSRVNVSASSSILAGLSDGEEVMRYHSLMLDPEALPKNLTIVAEVTDESENGREIMAIEHTTKPHYGVQFHPESFATPSGMRIARNFVEIVAEHNR